MAVGACGSCFIFAGTVGDINTLLNSCLYTPSGSWGLWQLFIFLGAVRDMYQPFLILPEAVGACGRCLIFPMAVGEM